MKYIIWMLILCASHLSTKAKNAFSHYRIQQDSVCVCLRDTTLKCCKKSPSTYYGNPLTLSAKEKMKYETMNAKTCCTHNDKKRSKNCAHCIKEAVKTK